MNKEKQSILHINEVYHLGVGTLTIDKKKIFTYFKDKYNIEMSNISTRYRDLTTSSIINTAYNSPKIGDESEILMECIEGVKDIDIITIKEDIRKIPRVENINIRKNIISFTFDYRVLANIK